VRHAGWRRVADRPEPTSYNRKIQENPMIAMSPSVPPQSLTVIRDFADLFDLLRDPEKVKTLLAELGDAVSRAHDATAMADERSKQAEAATAALAEAQAKAEGDAAQRDKLYAAREAELARRENALAAREAAADRAAAEANAARDAADNARRDYAARLAKLADIAASS
jgi:S-formylglutathione hydrolase FrmB